MAVRCVFPKPESLAPDPPTPKSLAPEPPALRRLRIVDRRGRGAPWRPRATEREVQRRRRRLDPWRPILQAARHRARLLSRLARDRERRLRGC